MHIIKINDNLKINLDTIYSIQHFTNNSELEQFEKIKLNFIKETYGDGELPEFEINGKMFRPNINDILENNVNDEINDYYIKFNDFLNELLSKPEEKNEYILFLSTGAKITIDKPLYEKLDKMLEKYVINK